ncbi:hypothetical protein D3C80_1827920 [compost metagenome]
MKVGRSDKVASKHRTADQAGDRRVQTCAWNKEVLTRSEGSRTITRIGKNGELVIEREPILLLHLAARFDKHLANGALPCPAVYKLYRLVGMILTNIYKRVLIYSLTPNNR